MSTYIQMHIGEGTDIMAWRFDSLAAAVAFREKYSDDPLPDGAHKDLDDIPVFPGTGNDVFGIRDNHETDTWVLIEIDAHGPIVSIDGDIVAAP